MEQKTGSKLGKEYFKAGYCHPAYLTYMQSTSCKIPSWINYKLESRFLAEISTTSDKQMIPFMAENQEEINSLLMWMREESKKLA